jgi:hypothetical protein
MILGKWKSNLPLRVLSFSNGVFTDSSSIGVSFDNNFSVSTTQYQIINSNFLKTSSINYLRLVDSSVTNYSASTSSKKKIEIQNNQLTIFGSSFLSTDKQNKSTLDGTWNLEELIYRKENNLVYQGRKIWSFNFSPTSSNVTIIESFPDGTQFQADSSTNTYLYETPYLSIPANATEDSPWYRIKVEFKENEMIWYYHNNNDKVFSK